MKHLQRSFWSFFLCFIFLSTAVSFCIYALNDESRVLPDDFICDTANVFSAIQKDDINREISEQFEELDCAVYILTVSDGSDYDVYDLISEYNLSGNMIILTLMDNNYHNYWLDVFGDADRKIKYSESELILDAEGVYGNIKSGKLYEGTLEFIRLSKEYYCVNWLLVIGISATIGAFVALLVAIIIIVCYKRKLKSTIYPLEKYANLDLKYSDDIFLGAHVTRRVIRDDDHGGGHGGGHGGHGGGGSHRGGR